MSVWEKLEKLLSVKSLIALALTGVFCYMSVSGEIKSDDYQKLFLMVISFYFGSKLSENKQ